MARDSDAILAAARASLVDQRAGGRRASGKAIGQRSAAIRRGHALARIKRMGLAVLVVLAAAFTAGLVLDGIGFTGLMLTGAAIVLALVVFARWPSLQPPEPGAMAKGPVRALVGNAQLWLEGQRPALVQVLVVFLESLRGLRVALRQGHGAGGGRGGQGGRGGSGGRERRESSW